MSDANLRIAVVTCAVLEMEIRHYARGLSQLAHIEVMEQGLHNEPAKLRAEVQKALDRVEARPDVNAIVLGYGLCSRGIEGLATQRCRLVVPRAHDCITVLLGSKERYAQYVKENPGTYWYSPGWNKCHTPPGQERYAKLYQQYVEKYGEDNAQYLMETEQQWFTKYNRATYVHLSVGATAQDLAYTQACADWLKWDYDLQQGDPRMLEDLLSGNWDDERFLVLAPGQTVRMTADTGVIEAIPVAEFRPVDSPALSPTSML